jgi:hypothetical protein
MPKPHEIADCLATELRLDNPDEATVRDLTEQLDDLVGKDDAVDLLRIALAGQGLR